MAAENTVRVASLNVLAARHTQDQPAATSGRDGTRSPRSSASAGGAGRRMSQLVARRGLDLLGLQALSRAGLRAFQAAGDGWKAYPLTQPADAAQRAAIAWRTSRWSQVRGGVDRAATRRGEARTPWVLLRNVQTGRKLYVVNVPSSRRQLSDPALNGTALLASLSTRRVPAVLTEAAPAAARAAGSSSAVDGGVRVSPVADPGDPARRTHSPLTVAEGRLLPSQTRFDFRVGSYNVLGASHTGGRGGYASGSTRMGWAMQEVFSHQLSVVGFQELQPVQQARFHQITGNGWSLYPGGALARVDGHNSIGWRNDVWEKVRTETSAIPYFHGTTVHMPHVLLRNRATGVQVWFANFHNPATTPEHGNNARWRAEATRREIALAHALRADGTPVVFTGDMNEREEYFCRVTAQTDLVSASGGSRGGGGCAPARPTLIDWIFGSPPITFSHYAAVTSGRRISDHKLIVATGSVDVGQPGATFAMGDMTLAGGQKSAAGLDPLASAPVRMHYTFSLLDQADIDVVGFQELTPRQLGRFDRLARSRWKSYPASREGGDTTTSIAWRTSEWNLVRGRSIALRTSGTARTRAPYVLLKNVATGDRVFVVNTYNPVLTVAEQENEQLDARRAAAHAQLLRLVDRLRRTGVPVMVTGGLDANTSPTLCRLRRQHGLVAPKVGRASTATCRQRRPVDDRILAVGPVRLTNFTVTRDGLVGKLTDTTLATADAQLSP